MVRAITCRNDPDMLSRDATQTSFWWADGAAEALVEMVNNRKGIRVRILGEDSSSHVNLLDLIMKTIHEVRQDISPSQFGLRQWATWKTGISIKIVDVEASTVDKNIEGSSVRFVNLHGQSVPYQSLVDGQLDPAAIRRDAEIVKRHMNENLDVLQQLEIKLEQGSIEETPLASGGFASVHGARFVIPLSFQDIAPFLPV